MTPATTFVGRRVALFGLGGSGLATALALKAGGADVAAWDDSAASLDRARAEGVPVVDLAKADWSAFAALVLSPGVPLTHPAPHWTVERAHAAGIEIVGDIELFCRERAKLEPDAPFVAITGTNGKSTTTALVAHILREAGRDVQMGGNIGTPILALEPPANDRVHVIEMSSFQIDLTPFFGVGPLDPPPAGGGGRPAGPDGGADLAVTSTGAANPTPALASLDSPSPAGEGSGRGPTVGVLLNITPDHLDRHGTMEAYAAIKERVIRAAKLAVVGMDDEPGRDIYSSARTRRPGATLFLSSREVAGFGYRVEGTRIHARLPDGDRAVADLASASSLRGSHNGQNAAAAAAVAGALGLDDRSVAAGFSSFPGLAHRMQNVARLGRTIFVNDSKATNADSAEKALSSFDGPIHWILGGVPKAGGIEPLKPLFTKIAKAYLIGEATEEFAVTLDEAGVSYERCGALDRAVAAAAADAARSDAAEPIVLLSPACASYDQYRNFELRGDHFRTLVQALPGVEMSR